MGRTQLLVLQQQPQPQPEMPDPIIGGLSAAAGFAGLGPSFASLDYNVKFMVEVENYTNFCLSPGNTELHTGQISEPPAAMCGGEKHGVVGHKTGHVAKGCCGVLSWEIEDSDEKLVLMYSIPYDQNLYSNWIAVGGGGGGGGGGSGGRGGGGGGGGGPMYSALI